MVKFLKTTKYPVKAPIADYRDNAYNAGIDGFIPTNTQEFRDALREKNPDLTMVYGIEQPNSITGSYFDAETGIFEIAPGEDVLIPSGLYAQLEPNSMLLDLNKSGIATKKKLAVGACVIDVSYQGIIHYHVYNFSKKPTIFKCDEKIVQMVQIPVLTGMEVEEGIEPEEFYKEKTDRGSGGFGSTGLA